MAINPSVNSAEAGLICGYLISRSAGTRELQIQHLADLTTPDDGVVWLHFNLSNARARSLLATAPFLPRDVREALCERDPRRRTETLSGGLLAVTSDLTFERDSEPAEVSPFWCYLSERLFITGRTHPLKTVDELRNAVRDGLPATSGTDLLTWFLGRRTGSLQALSADFSEHVSEIEDEILRGGIRQQREQLGRIRRLCAQLRRHFSPDRASFRKLLLQPPALLGEAQAQLLRSEIDDLAFLLDELNDLYERAKLLQEELAARVAENTGQSLYVLAILSAVFLPMTLITGIFGMNVAGMPGMHEPGSFKWVMILIAAAGALTLSAIFWRKRA